MTTIEEPMAVASRLTDDLAEWLPGQRWFAAKGRGIESVTPVSATLLYAVHDGNDPARLDHLLVEVRYTDSSPADYYQILVGYRRHLPERLEHVRIGEPRVHDDWRVAYDGLWDDELAVALLRLIASGERRGDLHFTPEHGAQIATDLPSRVIDAEQSNSSVVFDEVSILKLFRRIVPGVNPDVELARALHRVGCEHVPPLLGSVTGLLGSEPASYAMLTEYAENAADGWSMASASVRDLMAEEDLRADEVGGDFAAESHRLGEAVATVHADLARALGTGVMGPDGLATLAAQMETRLASAIHAVPDLEMYEERLLDAYAALANSTEPIPIQRIHGDLHLGQVLRTPYRWLLIDFEGEPIKPLAERVKMESPLRDIAGMLRSYDYAATHLLLAEEREAPVGVPEDHDAQLRYRTEEWINRNRDAFCTGYAQVSGSDPRSNGVVLRAYELDKAVYETVYETRNRPAWLSIPLSSIERLTAQ